MGNLIRGTLFEIMLNKNNYCKNWLVLQGEYKNEIFKLYKFDGTTLIMVNINTNKLVVFYHNVKVEEYKLCTPYNGIEPKLNFKNRILVVYELEVDEDYSNDDMSKVIRDNGLNFEQCLSIGKKNDNLLFKASDLLRDREERLNDIRLVLDGSKKYGEYILEEEQVPNITYIESKIYDIRIPNHALYNEISTQVYAKDEEDAFRFFINYTNGTWNRNELDIKWIGSKPLKSEDEFGVCLETISPRIKELLGKE